MSCRNPERAPDTARSWISEPWQAERSTRARGLPASLEADQRVLNLTTFETFFPEKRPFFLEGLDLFQPALRVDVGGPYGGKSRTIWNDEFIATEIGQIGTQMNAFGHLGCMCGRSATDEYAVLQRQSSFGRVVAVWT